MRVVDKEACGKGDDGVRDGGRCPGLGWNSQGERRRPEHGDPKKGDSGGTSSRRDEVSDEVEELVNRWVACVYFLCGKRKFTGPYQ